MWKVRGDKKTVEGLWLQVRVKCGIGSNIADRRKHSLERLYRCRGGDGGRGGGIVVWRESLALSGWRVCSRRSTAGCEDEEKLTKLKSKEQVGRLSND